jgi:hypothetical protein
MKSDDKLTLGIVSTIVLFVGMACLYCYFTNKKMFEQGY